jgi:hypothetical protein
MADQNRGQTRRSDDSLVPLITGLVVLAAVGPAVFTALTSWLLPRLDAGRTSASQTLAQWWDANNWLVAFWAVELVVLLVFLAWFRRRGRRRQRQLDSVAAGLARVLPPDWEPARDLRVLRWRGHRPVRLQLQLTPRSPLTDRTWRESVADAAHAVLGPVAPITWPTPPRGGVFDWGRRPPRVELRTAAAQSPTSSEDRPVGNRTDWRLSEASGSMAPAATRLPAEEPPIYRRPRPATAGRAAAGEPTHPGRED